MVKSKQKFALASTTDFASKLRFSMLATITPKTQQQQQKPEMFVLFSESLDVQAQTEIGLNGVGSQDLPGAFFVFGTAFLSNNPRFQHTKPTRSAWAQGAMVPRIQLYQRPVAGHGFQNGHLEQPCAVTGRWHTVSATCRT